MHSNTGPAAPMRGVFAVTRARTIALAVGFSVAVGATPALADAQFYRYSVLHPTYGDIGRFTVTIYHEPDTTRIESHLRIAVKLLGIVVFRQETDITEISRGNRLVSLQSVTEKDGTHFEVHGQAQGDRFVVHGSSGSFAGPAAVIPSDPWVRWRTGAATVVFTDTGRIDTVQVSGGEHDTVAVNGAVVSARHFVALGFKRQEVWLDEHGVPVKFRSVDYGAPIDFLLQGPLQVGSATGAVYDRVALTVPGNDR
jgi:hypothetical protein